MRALIYAAWRGQGLPTIIQRLFFPFARYYGALWPSMKGRCDATGEEDDGSRFGGDITKYLSLKGITDGCLGIGVMGVVMKQVGAPLL